MYLLGIVILVIVTVFLSIACLKGDQNEITDIYFKITWDEFSSRGVAISKIVNGFNEQQKDIHVTMVGGSEDKTVFNDALDNQVDVLMIPYRYLRDSDIANRLVVLDDIYMEQEEFFYDSVRAMSFWKGHAIGIPWIGHSMGLIYNEDLLDEAGIDPKSLASMQDLLEACEQIKQTTGAGGLGLVGANDHDLSWMVSQFIYSFDGALVEVDEEHNQIGIVINSVQSEAALDFYINQLGLYAQRGWEMDTGAEVMEAFAEREIAFEIQGPWGVTDIWKRGNPFKVGALSLNQIGMYSEFGPMLLSVNQESENIDAAKVFIRYLTQKDVLAEVMDGEYDEKYEAYFPYRVPLRKDMEDSEFFQRYPEFLVFIEGYKKPSINAITTEWEEVYNDYYEYYIHEAIMGNISIAQALTDIENKRPHEK